ncbi:MAG: TldD/PmbA family protein [Caldisericia bacterium]|nr:TldD/PmbA family protein [Caldisericia bacterium]
MFVFPKGFYVVVRIETIFETTIRIAHNVLEDLKEKEYQAAFIRLFDGKMWYYSSTTDMTSIQKEINTLASVGHPFPGIEKHPVVQNFEVYNLHQEEFSGPTSVGSIPKKTKLTLLEEYSDLLNHNEHIKHWKSYYVDKREVKDFYSSKGSQLHFDYEDSGFALYYDMVHGDAKFSDRFDTNASSFDNLQGLSSNIHKHILASDRFLCESKPVQQGSYTTVLSPLAAGIFAHESFGHKSESDFMVGDETMKKEWTIGKQVGSPLLSIIDTGTLHGKGYVPFDDEGTKAKINYLVKKGFLEGRLHSISTATALKESPTGNARAMNFEFEPIVRMTTTYIEKGDLPFDELLTDIHEGVYVDTVKHGSGMSTFTLAPARSYMIRKGKLAEPVQISVITGNVFKTLKDIEGLSNSLETPGFTLGGCGKMEQHPLRVSFGGPDVRIKQLHIQ